MVDVLIVTYGNRWHLLEKVLTGLGKEKNIRQVTVVNNKSNYDVNEKVRSLHDNRIKVLDLEKNFGSAYAYTFGLSYLLNQPQAGLILLLDDDNLPVDTCIDKMLLKWDLSTLHEKESQLMLMAMRPSRHYLQNASKGLKTKLFFPLKNHFLGFNLFRPDIWLMKKLYPRTLRNKPVKDEVSIPCAPYGGLFFHKKLLFKNGMPDKRFFTYADDFDFTYRHVKHNGSILLLPACIVNDLEVSLVNKKREGIFRPKFLQMEKYRLFCLMRNTMFFTKHYFITSRFIFAINRFIYTLYLFLLALIYGKLKTFFLFNSAVNKGLKEDFKTIPEWLNNKSSQKT